MNEACGDYEQQIKLAVEALKADRLIEASEEIMSFSSWLLSNVTELGE